MFHHNTSIDRERLTYFNQEHNTKYKIIEKSLCPFNRTPKCDKKLF